jgi:hypothetical protein
MFRPWIEPTLLVIVSLGAIAADQISISAATGAVLSRSPHRSWEHIAGTDPVALDEVVPLHWLVIGCRLRSPGFV